MQVPLVDKDDNIIGFKERAELDYSRDIFRTASLWITNRQGDVLVAQRTFDKKVDPGKWAEAVGGTVEGQDSYLETIAREACEELGVSDISMTPGPKQYIDDSAKYFIQWYTCQLDLPLDRFTIQASEIEQIAWIPITQLRNELDERPEKYVRAMKSFVELFDESY